MIKAIFLSIFLGLTLLPTRSSAESLDIPPFDFEKFCAEQTAFLKGNEAVYNACLSMERRAVQTIGNMGSISLPEGAGQRCIDTAQVLGGSYVALGLCLSRAASEDETTQPGTASQQPTGVGLPQYDINAYCTGVADAVGGSAQVELFCREQEQKTLQTLQGMAIPTEVMNYCDGVARVIGGSYEVFKNCAEQEISARQSLGK